MSSIPRSSLSLSPAQLQELATLVRAREQRLEWEAFRSCLSRRSLAGSRVASPIGGNSRVEEVRRGIARYLESATPKPEEIP